MSRYASERVLFAIKMSLSHTVRACRGAQGGLSTRDIIVHPKFRHTLPLRSSLSEPVTIHLLPLHVLSLVASKLDSVKDLCRWEQVCTTAREAVRYDDGLWKELCCSKFNMPRHACLREPGISWRDLYKYQHRLFYDILVYRRPDKLVNLGNGVLYINIPVMA